MTFRAPLPEIPDDIVRLTFPEDHVLHVAMNRPKQYNAMSSQLSATLNEVFNWFENEPTLWVAVLGSTSQKAFCAGADLIEWGSRKAPSIILKNGFGGLTERFTRKPIIGAVRGFALGGGSEICMNLDVVVAGDRATFGFPEAKRGVAVAAGGLQRFVRLVGHQRATEAILTGRNISPQEAQSLGMVNVVVPDDQVEAKALEYARAMAANSPDAVQTNLYAIRLTQEVGSVTESQRLFADSTQYRLMLSGDNIKEGLMAFAEKRKPNWVPSKL